MAVDPERQLALSYAVSDRQAPLAVLFALDDTLAQILQTTREPLVGQMRLTWWHGALSALDTAPPPAQPVLEALAAQVLPHGVTGAQLAAMIDGWEALLDAEELDAATIERHAVARGRGLFLAAATVLACPPRDPVGEAGTGWALADLVRHVRDRAVAERTASLAQVSLVVATGRRWSRAGRPLGALAHLARMDLAEPLDAAIARGAPRRVGRLALFRLTGR